MTKEIVQVGNGVLTTASGSQALPAIIVQAGGNAQKRFIEFFAAQIRNRNTREAYVRAVVDFFDWCEDYDIGALIDIEPTHVAADGADARQRHSKRTGCVARKGARRQVHVFGPVILLRHGRSRSQGRASGSRNLQR